MAAADAEAKTENRKMSNSKTEKLTQADLMQFTGDLERYRHPLNRRVIYTPGVQFLAEGAGAYWLIDVIASYFGSPEMMNAICKDRRLADLQFWRLDVNADNTARVTARADTNVKPFITQEIGFTDFPLEFVEIWAAFDGRHWTLYLPSEH